MPNLFLDDLAEVIGLDWEGQPRRYRVRVHRPVIPYFLVVGDPALGAEYLRWRDYVLPFPETAITFLQERLRRDSDAPVLERTPRLEAMGVIRRTRLGQAEVAAVQVPPRAREVCEDARGSLDRWRDAYELNRMERARDAGRFASSNLAAT